MAEVEFIWKDDTKTNILLQKKKKTPREIVKTEDEQKIFGFNVFKMQ